MIWLIFSIRIFIWKRIIESRQRQRPLKLMRATAIATEIECCEEWSRRKRCAAWPILTLIDRGGGWLRPEKSATENHHEQNSRGRTNRRRDWTIVGWRFVNGLVRFLIGRHERGLVPFGRQPNWMAWLSWEKILLGHWSLNAEPKDAPSSHNDGPRGSGQIPGNKMLSLYVNELLKINGLCRMAVAARLGAEFAFCPWTVAFR